MKSQVISRSSPAHRKRIFGVSPSKSRTPTSSTSKNISAPASSRALIKSLTTSVMTRARLPSPVPQPRPRIGPGLKLRLWLACLSGGLVAAAGTLWMLATPSLSPADPVVYGWLAGVACASLVIGLLLALWIDHHVVGHLHGLLLGLRSNRVAELRGLPAGAGWGELSELGDAVQDTLERRQREARALQDLERVREQLGLLFTSIEHWQRTERWDRPALAEGEVSAVGE